MIVAGASFDAIGTADMLKQQNIFIERDLVRLGEDIGHGEHVMSSDNFAPSIMYMKLRKGTENESKTTNPQKSRRRPPMSLHNSEKIGLMRAHKKVYLFCLYEAKLTKKTHVKQD